MQHGLKGMNELAQGLFLDGRDVNQAYAVHLFWPVAKEIAVAIDRDANTLPHQAFRQFPDKSLVTAVDIGVAPGTDDGDLHLTTSRQTCSSLSALSFQEKHLARSRPLARFSARNSGSINRRSIAMAISSGICGST